MSLNRFLKSLISFERLCSSLRKVSFFNALIEAFLIVISKIS